MQKPVHARVLQGARVSDLTVQPPDAPVNRLAALPRGSLHRMVRTWARADPGARCSWLVSDHPGGWSRRWVRCSALGQTLPGQKAVAVGARARDWRAVVSSSAWPTARAAGASGVSWGSTHAGCRQYRGQPTLDRLRDQPGGETRQDHTSQVSKPNIEQADGLKLHSEQKPDCDNQRRVL